MGRTDKRSGRGGVVDACIHPGEGAGKLSRVVHAMLHHAADSAGVLRKMGGGTRIETRKKARVVRDDLADELDRRRLRCVRVVEDLHGQLADALAGEGLDVSAVKREWHIDATAARTRLMEVAPDPNLWWLWDLIDEYV